MSQLRNTKQLLLPVEKQQQPGSYDPYPIYDLGHDKIHCDFESLASRLAGNKTVIVDGYVGVRFRIFVEKLAQAFAALGKKVLLWDVSAAFRPEAEIDALIEPYLGGDDPIFGFRAQIELSDFFDKEKLAAIHPDSNADINIIYGSGAALAGWEGPVVYVDIPKNEIQFRSRAGSVLNLGATEPNAPKKMYKRFYFIDWIVLNKHKKALMPKIDIVVDGQRDGVITWAEGSDIREGLKSMSRNGFRVRPWFEPGAWGGQWIRNNIPALPSDVPNYAWSFELIVPRT